MMRGGDKARRYSAEAIRFLDASNVVDYDTFRAEGSLKAFLAGLEPTSYGYYSTAAVTGLLGMYSSRFILP